MHLVNPFNVQQENSVNNRNNTPRTVADFVLKTHDHQVVRWEDVTVLTAKPVKADPDWPEFMPVSVQVRVDGKSVVRWERDFAKKSYPYLEMLGERMVIAYLFKGHVVKVVALDRLRDLPEGTKLPMSEIIELKRAAAAAMNLPVSFDGPEQGFINGMQSASAATSAAVQPATLVLRDIPAAPAEAAAVMAPAPDASVAEEPVTSLKAERQAALRAKIAAREQVTVYNKQTGALLTGIPVEEDEVNILEDGEYVTRNRDGAYVDHFKMKVANGGKRHRKCVVLVSAQIPPQITAAMSEAASAPHH